jgi:hypothetical protein
MDHFNYMPLLLSSIAVVQWLRICQTAVEHFAACSVVSLKACDKSCSHRQSEHEHALTVCSVTNTQR